MAEIGVLARSVHDGSPSDLVWKTGDVVSIHPDGHIWGSGEGLPFAWVIKIPGATVEECRAYVDSVLDVDGTQLKLRGKRLNYSTLPRPLQRQLDQDGYITITKSQADTFIANIA